MKAPCEHTLEDRYRLYDAQGIFCAYVCGKCEDDVRAKYRPEIFAGYSQQDVDEPIEEDY